MHCNPCAFNFALPSTGRSMAARMAMMAMTINSSIKVKAAATAASGPREPVAIEPTRLTLRIERITRRVTLKDSDFGADFQQNLPKKGGRAAGRSVGQQIQQLCALGRQFPVFPSGRDQAET